MKTNDMTQGPITPALISFTIPILLGNLFQQFYSVADTIIVGRTLGPDALAAVGATGTVNFLILGFACGLAQGFAVVTSQKFGAKDASAMKKTVSTGIMLVTVIGLILTAISMLSMKSLLNIMNTPDNIFADSYAYIMVICAGILATSFYNLFSCLLRAIGNSRVPLYFLILSSILNIGLDLLFIITFKWGVAGAAIATVFAQLISALLCGIYILFKEKSLVPGREEIKFNKAIAQTELYIGIPMALQFSITASGTMVMQTAINTFGSVAVAAFTAAGKCGTIFTAFFMSIGQSISTYVGQNYGKGDYPRIRGGVNVAFIITAIYGIISGILVCVLLPYELRLFFQGGESVELLLPYARIYMIESAFCYIPLGMIFIYRSAMQGYGSSMPALMAGFVEMVTRCACAFFAMHINSYAIAVFCDPLAWLVAGIYTLIAYLITLKKRQAVIRV